MYCAAVTAAMKRPSSLLLVRSDSWVPLTRGERGTRGTDAGAKDRLVTFGRNKGAEKRDSFRVTVLEKPQGREPGPHGQGLAWDGSQSPLWRQGVGGYMSVRVG